MANRKCMNVLGVSFLPSVYASFVSSSFSSYSFPLLRLILFHSSFTTVFFNTFLFALLTFFFYHYHSVREWFGRDRRWSWPWWCPAGVCQRGGGLWWWWRRWGHEGRGTAYWLSAPPRHLSPHPRHLPRYYYYLKSSNNSDFTHTQ